MNWIDYPENRPGESGPYLVSITRPYIGGDLTFKYVAFFNAENNQWFKYDSFTDENEVLERIQFRVNAWAINLPIYLR